MNINIKDQINIVNTEWPEVYAILLSILLLFLDIHINLKTNKELNENNLAWIKEIAKATGWEEKEVMEEIKNLDAKPKQRTEHHKALFDKYLREAISDFDKGNYEQAFEKIWGSFTALVKYHAAKNEIPIFHWDHRKIRNYITNNLSGDLRNLFKNLYDNAYQLHILFHEGIKDEDLASFKVYWNKTCEQLNKILSLI